MKIFTLVSTYLFTPVLALFITSNVLALNATQTTITIDLPGKVNSTIAPGIEYTSLNARATEKTVFINWITASEQNNSHFEVERSSDMVTFKTVAIVLDGFKAEGAGKFYRFKEDAEDIRKGKTIYYRLKQIDTDNQVHYSKVLTVQMNSSVILAKNQKAAYIKPSDTYCLQSAVKGNQILLSEQSKIAMVNISVENNCVSAGIFVSDTINVTSSINNA